MGAVLLQAGEEYQQAYSTIEKEAPALVLPFSTAGAEHNQPAMYCRCKVLTVAQTVCTDLRRAGTGTAGALGEISDFCAFWPNSSGEGNKLNRP